MSYYASIQVSKTDYFAHFKSCVERINAEDSPFDFRIRYVGIEKNKSILFNVEFFPQQKSIMYYPSGPSVTRNFTVADIFMPWFYITFRFSSNGSLSYIGSFYSAEQVTSTLFLDIIPSFLGNHMDMACCMGHDVIEDFNSDISGDLTTSIFGFITHYINSTFNDSLDYYMYSDTTRHVLCMNDSYPHQFPGEKISYTCFRCRTHKYPGLSCRTPSVAFAPASVKQVHSLYRHLSESSVWWERFPKILRVQLPPAHKGFVFYSARSYQNFASFILHYEIKSPEEYKAYIDEGYGDFYLDELDAFHPAPVAYGSPKDVTPSGLTLIRTSKQTLELVQDARNFDQLQKLGSTLIDEELADKFRSFDYYWNGN